MIKKREYIPFDTNGELSPVWCKINEIIDAVNELQENQNTYWTDIAEIKEELQTRAENVQPDTKSRPENVQDKFAEQRKWIGKLCKFWDDSDKPENCVYDVLCNIFDSHHEDCPFQCGNGEWYEYCEPVKPDAPIIYKGDDNE